MLNHISMFLILVSENLVNYFINSESEEAENGAGCLRKGPWAMFHSDSQPDISARGFHLSFFVMSSGG